jgi:hypothetical protein
LKYIFYFSLSLLLSLSLSLFLSDRWRGCVHPVHWSERKRERERVGCTHKKKVRACSKHSSFSQPVSQHVWLYYILRFIYMDNCMAEIPVTATKLSFSCTCLGSLDSCGCSNMLNDAQGAKASIKPVLVAYIFVTTFPMWKIDFLKGTANFKNVTNYLNINI